MKPENYSIMKRAYNCKSNEETIILYDEIAYDCQDVLLDGGYDAPYKMSMVLNEHIQEKRKIILDVGCGTGLFAEFLKIFGFDLIDGLDVSANMLDICKEKYLYRDLFEINVKDIDPDIFQQYDIVAGCGIFTVAHVPPEYFHKLIDLAKVKGYIIISCTEPVYTEMNKQINKESYRLDLIEMKAEKAMTPNFKYGYPYRIYLFQKRI